MADRKATDVLLDIENDIKSLLGIVKNQDLNIKILSNKINELNSKINITASANKFTTETVNTNTVVSKNSSNKEVLIAEESPLSVEDTPIGMRRTSRPETFSDNERKQLNTPTIQSKATDAEIKIDVKQPIKNAITKLQEPVNTINIPVSQRIVDKHNKSVFLADVEIIDLKTGLSIIKTRTNATGKWSAVLTGGNYRSIVRKRDMISKLIIETSTDITIDGSKSPYELSQIILK